MSFPRGFPGVCGDCGTARQYACGYDAVLCPTCDEWQSPLCGRCDACAARPARPSELPDGSAQSGEPPAGYDIDTADDAELLRRIARPVVEGTLPASAVTSLQVVRTPGMPWEHWPDDLPAPDTLYVMIALTSGEVLQVFLALDGVHVASETAALFAERLEDEWAESRTGWGQRVVADYRLPAD